MSPIKVTIHGTGEGPCSLTGKEGKGLTVTFDDGMIAGSFLSWASFKQLLALRTKQHEKPKMAAPVGNGPVPVAAK